MPRPSPVLNYSKWDGVHYDEDEEACAPPAAPDPFGMRSFARRAESQTDEARQQYILRSSVEYEKGRQEELGIAPPNTNRCWTCQQVGATMRCGRCKIVFFCGKECQRGGWRAHKFQCREVAEDEAERIRKERENDEYLAARAEQEEKEYGPRGEIGPVQRIAYEQQRREGGIRPPYRKDGSLCLAIIIPFRQQLPLQDRSSHLRKIVPHLHSFLPNLVRAGVMRKWTILVVEQARDDRPFNRGALLNAGFKHLDQKGVDFDQVMFHDVDLLAKDSLTQSWYAADLSQGCIAHLTKDGYDKYAGPRRIEGTLPGVLLCGREDFRKTDGFHEDIWGYSERLEDKLWTNRLQAAQFKYLDVPAGKWEDLDTIDLRNCPEACRNVPAWFDHTYVRCVCPSGDPQALGKAEGERPVMGPSTPQADEMERVRILCDRKGGLSSPDHRVVSEELCLVHATKIEVLVNYALPEA